MRLQRAKGAATISKRRQRSFEGGYKSGFEKRVSRQIEDAGLSVQYETDQITYTWPERQATYTPDFKLPKQGGFFYVETKGRWDVDDRQKHLLIKDQFPDLDIRLCFLSDGRLYKGSPTRYSEYCEKHGLRYSLKHIPEDWLREGEIPDDTEPEDC